MYPWVIEEPGKFVFLVLCWAPLATGAILGTILSLLSGSFPGIVLLPFYCIGAVLVGFVPASVALVAVFALESRGGIRTWHGVVIAAATSGLFGALFGGTNVGLAALMAGGMALCGAFPALLAVWLGDGFGVIAMDYRQPGADAGGAGDGNATPRPEVALSHNAPSADRGGQMAHMQDQLRGYADTYR